MASYFDKDHIGIALLASLILHGLLIFGIRFHNAKLDSESNATKPIILDVMLTHAKPTKPPEKADFLAENNQQGQGNSKVKAPPQRARKKAQPLPQSQPKLAKPPLDAHAIVAQTSTAMTNPTPRPEPSAAELIQYSQKIARLDEAIDESMQIYAEQPKQKYISASTREYRYASYMDAWRQKVERIGNLNYPAHIKRLKLTGHVLLDVILKSDGSIHDIILIKSSGNTVIDQAAINIARIAAPYSPFPSDIKAETDLLHITRTWKFLRDNRLLNQ